MLTARAGHLHISFWARSPARPAPTLQARSSPLLPLQPPLLPRAGAMCPLTPQSCSCTIFAHGIQVDVLDASDQWAWLGAWEPIHISVEWERYTVAIPVETSRAGNYLDGTSLARLDRTPRCSSHATPPWREQSQL